MVAQYPFRLRQYELYHCRHIAVPPGVVMHSQITIYPTCVAARDPLITRRNDVACDAACRETSHRPSKVCEPLPYPSGREWQPSPQRVTTAPESLPFHDRDRPKYRYPEENETVLHQRRNE